jgi:uncharacterized protein (TIRG00374 family)
MCALARNGRFSVRLPHSASILKWLRIIFAIGVLVVLVIKVGHAKPLERLAAAKPGYFILAVGMLILDSMVRTWNWTQLIRAMHVAPTVRYATVLGISWTGAFLGQVVPSTAGTDALRATLAARKIGGHASAHGAAVVMLNAISLTASCVVALACAVWFALTSSAEGVRPLATGLFAFAISAAFVGYWLLRSQRGLLLRMLRTLRGPFRKYRRGLRRFLHRMLVFERYGVHPAPIFVVALLTLLTRATAYALVGLAIGLTLPIPAWIALVPAYMLSGLIPYSVSGYGGDQAALVYILTGFGATAGAALTFALIAPLSVMALNMLCGVSLLFDQPDAKADPPLMPEPGRDHRNV